MGHSRLRLWMVAGRVIRRSSGLGPWHRQHPANGAHYPGPAQSIETPTRSCGSISGPLSCMAPSPTPGPSSCFLPSRQFPLTTYNQSHMLRIAEHLPGLPPSTSMPSLAEISSGPINGM
ncbi:hypothetical protein CENSYa_1542 [Cenarchaeum symbiosum A]|uniref:Uncharacterized protein n=1 Tax=Cenarchaeum symbiosum (strain A) TaxID=414004 RepID=A0RXU7_CENSY|nr:hypothetical protein CENSYa_1542 [Cenarchaeum symbiosum A]